MFIFFSFLKQINSTILPSGIDTDILDSSISALIQKMSSDTFNLFTSGVVIVSNATHSIYNGTFGYADIENNISTTLDTLYEWGSITKLITHTCIMQLYEQGKVNFDDDIEEYLGKKFFNHRNKKGKITILNLMHHNAGFEETVLETLDYTGRNYSSFYDYMRKIQPHQFTEPGKIVSYSNYGVALEGLIVERVMGKKFYEYVHEYVFKPIGIDHTSIDPYRRDLPELENLPRAQGYIYQNSTFPIRCPYNNISILQYPAGSALGPVVDLAKFIRALTPNPENPKSPLFAKESTLELFLNTSYRVNEKTTGIAHGFWENYYINKAVSREHPGNTVSFTAIVSMIPEFGISVCALVNREYDNIWTKTLPVYVFGSYIGYCYLQECVDNSNEIVGNYTSFRGVQHGPFKYSSSQQIVEIKVIDNALTYSGTQLFQVEQDVYNIMALNLPLTFWKSNPNTDDYDFSFVMGDTMQKTDQSHQKRMKMWHDKIHIIYIFGIIFAGLILLYFVFYLFILGIKVTKPKFYARPDAIIVSLILINVLIAVQWPIYNSIEISAFTTVREVYRRTHSLNNIQIGILFLFIIIAINTITVLIFSFRTKDSTSEVLNNELITSTEVKIDITPTSFIIQFFISMVLTWLTLILSLLSFFVEKYLGVFQPL